MDNELYLHNLTNFVKIWILIALQKSHDYFVVVEWTTYEIVPCKFSSFLPEKINFPTHKSNLFFQVVNLSVWYINYK